MEGGREGGMEGLTEGGMEGGREGGRNKVTSHLSYTPTHLSALNVQDTVGSYPIVYPRILYSTSHYVCMGGARAGHKTTTAAPYHTRLYENLFLLRISSYCGASRGARAQNVQRL